MSQLPEIMNELLKFDIDRDEWDQPPMLFVVGEPVEGDPESPVALIALSSIGDGTAPELMEQLADMLLINKDSIEFPPFPFKSKILGTIVRFEGWSFVQGKEASPEKQKEQMAYLEAGNSIADHPDGGESMGFVGVDDDGVYFNSHTRYTGPTTFVGDEAQADFSGRVLDALLRVNEGIIKLTRR